MRKRFLFGMMALVCLCSMTSCADNKSGSVDFGEYNPTSEATTVLKYDTNDLIDVDDSWQNKYALSYSFYDKKTGESKIAEGKCGRYYQAIDYTSAITTFISQESGYVVEYILDSKTKTGTSSVNTEATIDELYSGFSQFSTCDPYFPVYKNVTKFDTEFIANRSATRYKQVETENGVETRIAYVWIDDAFGFASKCELYDAQTEELLLRWELLSFTLDATEEAVKVNVDEYEITQ